MAENDAEEFVIIRCRLEREKWRMRRRGRRSRRGNIAAPRSLVYMYIYE